MNRPHLPRQILLFLAGAFWVFLMLSLGSFHSTDWPSHEVYPYPPVKNLCGPAGSLLAYYCFLVVGQGVFPILFFSGICLALIMFRNPVKDFWLRAIGLILLSVAFAAAIHTINPGSSSGLPEGHGGLIGIGASHFLQTHFHTVGTRLVLLVTFIIGLLLAADDLVLRTPGVVMAAYANAKDHAPRVKFNFKLPHISLPNWLHRGVAPANPAEDAGQSDQTATAVLDAPKSPAIPAHVPVELSYDNDDPTPAAPEMAHEDDSHAPPSEAATIPVEPEPQTLDPEPSASQPDTTAAPAPAPKPALVVRLPNNVKPRQTAPPPMPKELGDYQLPNWELLADAEHGYAEVQEKFVREKAVLLERSLKEFNIDANVVEIDTGPVITMYELSLAPGIKVAQIQALTNDIARALSATSVRIVAPVPGKNTVGIEVPNAQKEKVRLKELMQRAPEETHKYTIPLFLGKDASGEPLVADLAAMPHCLIAGTTGSGKSVCINSIIISILYRQRPDMVKLILVDPKVVEMKAFEDLPHLMCPIINDSGRATSVLEWACEKMDERYELLAEAGVRNIAGYNKLTREELVDRFKPSSPEEEAKIPKKMPYVVIIIDELADLMMTSGKEVEASIVRLAQKARAVGIHLIVATQRPQATVVTGLIKSNLPCKIAFRMNTRMDSRIVLDQNGAEVLLGHGDMLYLPPGMGKPLRAQGTFVDDKEIRQSMEVVKTLADAQFEPELVQIKATLNADGSFEKDELFDDAVRVVLETKRGSVSLLQRRLTIGYARASRLIEQMAAMGILGEYKGSQAREVTMTLEEWDAAKAQEHKDHDDGMTV